MAFYFRNFPLIQYDVKKNNKSELLTNIMTRFKIVEAFQRQEAIYYDYSVKEGERADTIAFKYYGDATLDWVVYLVNDIVDPEFDWPMSTAGLNRYIVKKYGNITAANEQVHHYELLVQEHQVLYDGTIIPEKYEQIDLTTYNASPSAQRKIVTAYEYEIEANDAKRSIKLLSDEFLPSLLTQVKTVFNT